VTGVTLDHFPVLYLAAAYAVSCVIVFATDSFALPQEVAKSYRINRGWRQVVLENLARLPICALVYAGFFAISWRPLYAAHGTITFFCVFTVISRIKFIHIREPLIFSDLALVIDLLKNRTLFYATFLNLGFWTVALGYSLGLTGAYMWLERPLLPDHWPVLWIFTGILCAFGPWVLPFVRCTNRPIATFSENLLKTLDPHINTIRFGAFSSIIYHYLIWLGRRREEVVAELQRKMHHVLAEAIRTVDHKENAAPLFVIWQSESFLDLRNCGVNDLELPHLDRLKRRASQWGQMKSIFEGGYTLRTEFAVLTGLQPDDVHVDASHPYISASHYSEIAWPRRFLDNGWTTHFLHPFDRTFFFRDKAMPLLGFQHMTMLDAFDHDMSRDGPYVSDKRLARRVIDTIQNADNNQPSFVFVASMENHGPWEPGRVGALTDPVDIYKELLRKADEALGFLSTYLDSQNRPVWLVFYGDHAPLLKSFADPFPDPRTDYLIVPLGTARCMTLRPVAPQETAPWDLIQSLLSHSNPTRKAEI